MRWIIQSCIMTTRKGGVVYKITRATATEVVMSQLLEFWIGFISWYATSYRHFNTITTGRLIKVFRYIYTLKSTMGGFLLSDDAGFEDKGQSWKSSPQSDASIGMFSLHTKRDLFVEMNRKKGERSVQRTRTCVFIWSRVSCRKRAEKVPLLGFKRNSPKKHAGCVGKKKRWIQSTQQGLRILSIY